MWPTVAPFMIVFGAGLHAGRAWAQRRAGAAVDARQLFDTSRKIAVGGALTPRGRGANMGAVTLCEPG